MTTRPTREDLEALERHYAGLAKQHGDAPESAQWSSRASQEKRLELLCELGDLRRAKVLDLGCGTAHLLEFLRSQRAFEGEYVGWDLAEPALELARARLPGVRLERRDIFSQGVGEDFDHVLISGVFNNKVSDNWAYLTSTLKLLWPHCRRGLAFNLLSTYVDWFEDDLFYADPERVFRFCKEELSPAVALRHDYLVREGAPPFEFTVYVRNVGLPCRPHREGP
jgi:SAM-dependent methyltransferase